MTIQEYEQKLINTQKSIDAERSIVISRMEEAREEIRHKRQSIRIYKEMLVLLKDREKEVELERTKLIFRKPIDVDKLEDIKTRRNIKPIKRW